MRDGVERGKA